MDITKGNIVEVNIATALAIQGMLELGDLDGKPLPKPALKIQKDSSIAISINTFTRNWVGALEDRIISKRISDIGVKLPSNLINQVVENLTEDLETLHRYLLEAGYFPLWYYSTIPKFKEGKLRVYKSIGPDIAKEAYKRFKKNKVISISTPGTIDQILPLAVLRKELFLLSSIPYDILTARLTHKVALVESHTGKVKLENEFSSKYYPVPKHDMSNLPFTGNLLRFLGDRNTTVPEGIILRRELMDILKGKTTYKTKDFNLESIIRKNGSDLLRAAYFYK